MSTILLPMMRTHIIAIVRLENYDRAEKVAQSLIAGGISVIEFTLTGKGAVRAIDGAALIGAGTVLTTGDVQDVVSAGAQFVVTPVLNHKVIAACHHSNVPIVCGALTPTELQAAYEAGAEMQKVFPARQFGPQYMRDLLAPLPHLRLVPTGGVSQQNAAAYIKAGAVAVGMGGNLVSEQAVASGDWMQITRQAQDCIQAVQM
jgi:2-dehydro-3-deoxyphosphogluconate aldolase / (4S)-4-hydroxy-2-oxoglutarate aldolase